MAGLNKFDPRVDALVMETRTHWDDEVGTLEDADRNWLSAAVHADPASASKVSYVRSHTGFTREITVTVADIERIYHERTQ